MYNNASTVCYCINIKLCRVLVSECIFLKLAVLYYIISCWISSDLWNSYCDGLCWIIGLISSWLFVSYFLLDFFTTTTTTVLRPFFRDHPGELVPEENFWTLWHKGRLTEADTPTIQLGATPSGLTSAHLHHPPIFFTGRMPFLPPNQQCQSTEGIGFLQTLWNSYCDGLCWIIGLISSWLFVSDGVRNGRWPKLSGWIGKSEIMLKGDFLWVSCLLGRIAACQDWVMNWKRWKPRERRVKATRHFVRVTMKRRWSITVAACRCSRRSLLITTVHRHVRVVMDVENIKLDSSVLLF